MNTNPAVIVSADIRGYFHDEVDSVLSKQAVKIDDATAIYLVNLLATFIRARELFEETDDGLQLRPLALHYADAINAQGVAERTAALRKLGDIALFISGVFADSLNRKLVDIDYYIAMGGSAYSYVHDISLNGGTGLFAELAEKFGVLVDVLNEISERSNLQSNANVLRLYDVWLKTGSNRAYDKLQRLGLNPTLNATSVATH